MCQSHALQKQQNKASASVITIQCLICKNRIFQCARHMQWKRSNRKIPKGTGHMQNKESAYHYTHALNKEQKRILKGMFQC